MFPQTFHLESVSVLTRSLVLACPQGVQLNRDVCRLGHRAAFMSPATLAPPQVSPCRLAFVAAPIQIACEPLAFSACPSWSSPACFFATGGFAFSASVSKTATGAGLANACCSLRAVAIVVARARKPKAVPVAACFLHGRSSGLFCAEIQPTPDPQTALLAFAPLRRIPLTAKFPRRTDAPGRINRALRPARVAAEQPRNSSIFSRRIENRLLKEQTGAGTRGAAPDVYTHVQDAAARAFRCGDRLRNSPRPFMARALQRSRSLGFDGLPARAGHRCPGERKGCRRHA